MLGELAEQTAEGALEAAYGRHFEIEIIVEEGSGKVRVKVIVGTLVVALEALHVTYSTIADYKGFKESIGELCKDARAFGDIVCNKVPAAIGVETSHVYRKERRLSTPGRLGRVIERVEQLEANYNDLTPSQVREQLRDIKRQLGRISEDVSSSDMEIIEKALTTPKLGSPIKWPEPPLGGLERVAISVRHFEVSLQDAELIEGPSSDKIRYHKIVPAEAHIERSAGPPSA